MRTRPTPRRSTRLLPMVPLLFALSAAGLSGCGSDKNTNPNPTLNVQAILGDVATTVILATYTEMDSRIDALVTAVTALHDEPTPARLAAAQQAWREARVPWEASEGFLFGPVETLGLDPSIDSWPVNTVDLDNVMSNAQPLTPEFVEGLEGTLKGYHTTEYLLFGVDGTQTATNLSARELEYLAAATAAMQRTSHRLRAAWSPAGDNYAAQLATAGTSGSVYVSQKAGLQELITGMATIADEVANGKINDPFSARDITLEESRFSANSIADFQDNIRSIQSVYRGDYGGHAGHGVNAFVAGEDAQLDARFDAQVQAAIDAIGAIPPPFTTAIFSHPEAITTAQLAVRRVQQTLDEEITPLLDRY